MAAIKDEGPWYTLVDPKLMPAGDVVLIISHMTGVRLEVNGGGKFATTQAALEYAQEMARRLNEQATLWQAMVHVKELCDSKVKMTPETARTMLIRDTVTKALSMVQPAGGW